MCDYVYSDEQLDLSRDGLVGLLMKYCDEILQPALVNTYYGRMS